MLKRVKCQMLQRVKERCYLLFLPLSPLPIPPTHISPTPTPPTTQAIFNVEGIQFYYDPHSWKYSFTLPNSLIQQKIFFQEYNEKFQHDLFVTYFGHVNAHHILIKLEAHHLTTVQFDEDDFEYVFRYGSYGFYFDKIERGSFHCVWSKR